VARRSAGTIIETIVAADCRRNDLLSLHCVIEVLLARVLSVGQRKRLLLDEGPFGSFDEAKTAKFLAKQVEVPDINSGFGTRNGAG
jgi:hypothetical protein